MQANRYPVISLIIPIYNAEKEISILFSAILKQSLKLDQILVIDSSSTDRSKELLASFPVQIHTIPKKEFDHGGTRKLATQLVESDIYIFLTQDAIPADERAFQNLIDLMLSDESIACAFGRQLPKDDATPLGTHARLFNYPDQTQIKTYQNKENMGIKTCFNSNSFAAYRKVPLNDIGNFPDKLIVGEDVFVAARLLQKGYTVAYVANATVRHSHNFSLLEEFHRYFSIGVFHAQENWILKDFNTPLSEGRRFVQSEIKFLIRKRQFHWLPKAFLSTLAKFVGYHLGLHAQYLPYFIKKNLGVNKTFWIKKYA